MASDAKANWQDGKSVLERNRIMLEQQLLTDVTFVFPRQIQHSEFSENMDYQDNVIRAHKYMLVSSSSVFWDVFKDNRPENNTISVDDVHFEAFTQMLKFLYYEDTKDLTVDLAVQTLRASNKYMIPVLAQICVDFLERHLDPHNVCAILEQALVTNEHELENKCMKLIQSETEDVLMSDGFPKISKDALVKILSNDNLRVREIDVFNAAKSWALAQSGNGDNVGDVIRTVLGEALYRIRFPLMSADELATIVSPSGVLTKEEECQCFRYINGQAKSQDLPFSTEKRDDSQFKDFLLEHSLAIREILSFKPQCLVTHSIQSLHRNFTMTGLRVLCEDNHQVSLNVENPQLEAPIEIPMHSPIKITKQDPMRYTDIEFPSPVTIDKHTETMVHITYQNPPGDVRKLALFTFDTSDVALEKRRVKLQIKNDPDQLGQTILGVFV